MTANAALLLAHGAATLAMTGLIWFVQLVHYPLFRWADATRFERFAAEHQRRTTWVVLPLMAVEAAAASLLLVYLPGAWSWVGWLLLAVIWLSTLLLQIPLHRRLNRGLDAAAVDRLVATNWLRTLAWTARSGVTLIFLISPNGN